MAYQFPEFRRHHRARRLRRRTGIGAEVGITGTPVIDPASGTLYVVAMTYENGNAIHRLHALDITTGSDKLTPVAITATVPGTGAGNDGQGNVPFHAITQNQRASLLLANGVVYVAFAAFSDVQPYHGWLFAFDSSTLQFIDVFNPTPNTSGGGMWAAGSGPVVDVDGNIFIASANGFFPNDLSNSVLKLNLIGGHLTLVDQFVPYNQQCLNNDDLDVASTGPLLLPDQSGLYSHLLVVGSKEGKIYLLNRDNLGGHQSTSDSQIPQSILLNAEACGATGFNANSPLRFYGSASYWNGNVYWGTVFGPLLQYTLNDGQLTLKSKSTYVFQGSGQTGRGPLPVVSAAAAGNGIVWASIRRLPSAKEELCLAFDATEPRQPALHQ